MTTRTSLFNFGRFKAMYKATFLKHKGILISLLLFTTVLLVVPFIMTAIDEAQWIEYSIERTIAETGNSDFLQDVYAYFPDMMTYNGFSIVAFTAYIFLMCLFVTSTMFSYMQNKRSVDLFHALPVTRGELMLANSAVLLSYFWSALIYGFTAIGITSFALLPVGVDYLLMVVTELLMWMGMLFILHTITVFAIINVGTVFDGVVFSLGLLSGPVGAYLMSFLVFGSYVYGFNTEPSFEVSMYLSPVLIMGDRLVDVGIGTNYSYVDGANELLAGNLTMFLWVLIAIALYFVTYYLYLRRHSEIAESVGNLGPLQILMRALGTFLAGIGIAMIFLASLDVYDNKTLFVVFVVLFSALSYCIGEFILVRKIAFTVRLLKHAAIAGVLMGVFGVVSVTGLFGYETRLPSVDEIESVQLETYMSHSQSGASMDNYGGVAPFTSPEVINAVLAIHEGYVSERENLDNRGYFRVHYTLKNGDVVSRYYGSGTPSNYYEQLKILGGSDEIVQKQSALFIADDGRVESMELYSGMYTLKGDDNSLYIDRDDYTKILDALRTDLLAVDENSLSEPEMVLGSIWINYESKYYDEDFYTSMASVHTRVGDAHVNIRESFTNTIAVLKQLGYDEYLIPTVDEVVADAQKVYVYDYIRDEQGLTYASDREIHYIDAEDIHSSFVEMSVAELEELAPHLFSVAYFTEKMAMVDITVETSEGFVTYLLPYELLPVNLPYAEYYEEEKIYLNGTPSVAIYETNTAVVMAETR